MDEKTMRETFEEIGVLAGFKVVVDEGMPENQIRLVDPTTGQTLWDITFSDKVIRPA